MIIPLAAKDAPTPEFDPPQGAKPRVREQLEPPSFERTIQTDQATGLTTFTVMDTGAREHDSTRNLTTWGSTKRIYTMPADQQTPTMHSLREINLIDNEHHLKTLVDAGLHSDENYFYSDVTLTAWEDDKQLLQRTWKDKMPRNGS